MTAKTKDCTKENPMPEGADATKVRWVHHDVDELEDLDTSGILYKCNSCGLRFVAKF